jgi:predicted outer membrane repeat protein
VRTEITSIVCVVVGVTLFSTLAAHARVRYVASDGGGQDGLSWASAYTSIQGAINDSAMAAGDEIHVKAGTYAISPTIRVTKAVKILGGFSGDGDTRDWTTNTTTLNGADWTMCMIVTANAYIEGLTFTRGRAYFSETESRGGALFIGNCSATVTHCVFSANTALERGGAIGTKHADGTTITDCSFTGNSADQFGGAIANQDSDLTISDCTFQGNRASVQADYLGGGGIFNDSGAPTISGCTFTGNTACAGAGICNYMADAFIENCSFLNSSRSTAAGGGVMNYDCSAMITRCLFQDNQADSGGAVWDQSTSTFVNCIMWGNNVARYGGAIHFEPSDGTATVRPKIINCTIYGNAASTGGAIHSTEVKATIRNCIIWNNFGYGSGPGIHQSASTEQLEVAYCDVQGDNAYPGTGNVCVEPGFVDAESGDFELIWGAPCIDIGDGTAPGLGSVDYAGKTRVIDGDEDDAAVVDLGAFEFRGRYVEDYLFGVEISQSIVYSSPTDTAPNHVFLLTAETAGEVVQIQFHSPGGNPYTITLAPHANPSAYVDTYHTTNGNRQTWMYRGTFPSFPLLADYGDGTYYLTLLYEDGTSHQTTFWYGVPNSLTTLARPTQLPNVTVPVFGGSAASPVVFSWDACTDAGANDICLRILNSGTNEVLASELLAVAATHNTGFPLEERQYDAQIAFQNHYEVTTADGIPFVYGKAVVVPHQLEVPYSTVYRFWWDAGKQHFFTIKEGEKKKLIERYANVWAYEGPVFKACATQCHSQLVPVYRFWSTRSGEHFFTIKEGEKQKLIDNYVGTWVFEGVGFYAYAPGTQPSECKPVYRFWNAKTGEHFYTIKEGEKEKLMGATSGYAYENVAFYAYE